jgi:glycosyltransferase involved in cell wall biosynthesis
MRILHLYDEKHYPESNVPLNRGIYGVIFSLSRHFVERGHEVTVIIRRCVSGVDYVDGIKIVKFKSGNLIKNVYIELNRPWHARMVGCARIAVDSLLEWLRVQKFVKKNDFDIIHAHFPLTACMLIYLDKELRNKMVYTAHIGSETERFNLDGKAPFPLKVFSPDLYLIKQVRKSIILNESLKYKLVGMGIEEERIEVIPNGINVEDFNISRNGIERVRKKYGFEGVIVMFVGTVTPRKGVLHLIRAGEILNLGKHALFLIIGNLDLDREYAQKVIEYARSRGVNVKFTGFVPYEDLKAIYAACDIFVLPSFEEGDPIALKEAMASGKPLIGSNVGGISMQIRDGWNGYLVKPGNEKELAERIKYLVDNEGERERMGKNSRKLAEEEFDWAKIAKRHLEVYEKLKDINNY